MSQKFKELFILAAKENARNRRIARYNQNATLGQLVPFENKAFLHLVGYVLTLNWQFID